MGYKNINIKDSGRIVNQLSWMKEESNNWWIKGYIIRS
jgi:ABC-type molybdenum transport system ATPase subunit/photorepair protein PhrA